MLKFNNLILKIVLILTISTSAFAVCDKNVTRLDEGETAPCSGFLFTPQKELEVRLKIEENNYLKEFSKTQTEINEILNKRLDESQKYNEYLSKRLSEEKDNAFWQTTLYFGLGVLITGFIAANVNR